MKLGWKIKKKQKPNFDQLDLIVNKKKKNKERILKWAGDQNFIFF